MSRFLSDGSYPIRRATVSPRPLLNTPLCITIALLWRFYRKNYHTRPVW